MWGKKKSAKVLIVGNNSELFKIVAANKSLLNCKQTRVKSREKALQVALSGTTFFDFLVTDLMNIKMDDEDFAKKFNKLSPSTKVIYMIP